MNESAKVRLDRWLWAARFYKTRSAAKDAIDGGKVHCSGQRAKPSKEIGIGTELVISRGEIEQTVVVTGISERRGGAKEAAELFRETLESIERRTAAAAQRRLFGPFGAPPARPDRRARRELLRMKQTSHPSPDDDE